VRELAIGDELEDRRPREPKPPSRFRDRQQLVVGPELQQQASGKTLGE
jgi:hypothetical protein